MSLTASRDPNPRRIIRWENIRGPRAIAVLLAGTALGAGLFPFGPGTMGSIFGLPLAWWSSGWDWPYRVLLWVGLTALGTWAAKEFDEIMGTHDNQRIVIDEVIGMGITAWTAGRSVKTLAVAFVLFRFFDILKPPPVRQIDRWSKKGSAWLGGFGVMADDIVAAFQGLIVILILQHFQILP